MEILCAYIRQNSPVSESKKSPHEVFQALTTNNEDGPGLNAENAYQHENFRSVNIYGWHPPDLNHNNLKIWASKLKPVRLDVQAAISVIGRRLAKSIRAEKEYGFKIDFSATNLQGYRLAGNFGYADLTGSRLDGAQLTGIFDGVDATHSSFRGAQCASISMKHSMLLVANLDSCDFYEAKLDYSALWMASLNRTHFNAASLFAADLYNAKPKDVYFHAGADASWARLQNLELSQFKGIEEGPSGNLFMDGRVDASVKRNASSKADFDVPAKL